LEHIFDVDYCDCLKSEVKICVLDFENYEKGTFIILIEINLMFGYLKLDERN